jgi:hypothetical protein
MKYYCYETEFIFSVEPADAKSEENLIAAWWKKDGDKFIKAYPKEFDNGVSAEDKELVKRNFARLGQLMFEGVLIGTTFYCCLPRNFRKMESNGT